MTGADFDFLVIGAGPAGLSAAVAAAENGARVLLVDENADPGGQIWRKDLLDEGKKRKRDLVRRANDAGVETAFSSRISVVLDQSCAILDSDAGTRRIEFGRAVIATGARELMLPFPGWTFPNVFGIGGLQALVKSGFDVAGKRIAISGTGPLLPAVGSFLKKRGARIVIVAEQATSFSLVRFAASMVSQPRKLLQARDYLFGRNAVTIKPNRFIRSVRRDGSELVLNFGPSGGIDELRCDILATGFHLVPNTDVAMAFGCEIRNGRVVTDDFQETSVKGIYAAGEPTGISGVEGALAEGTIAGFAASGAHEMAEPLFRKRDRETAFGGKLDLAFMLRPELRELAEKDTIICRCEDVKFEQLRNRTTWREAKLLTRCGMGPCQGRICGPAYAFLFNQEVLEQRNPIQPLACGEIAKGS